MRSTATSDQKAFFAKLLRAKERHTSTLSAIWASRWALLQWLVVFVVFGIFFVYAFGPAQASNVFAAGIGLMLGLLLQLRQGMRTWPWLVGVIDWNKVERELAGGTENGA